MTAPARPAKRKASRGEAPPTRRPQATAAADAGPPEPAKGLPFPIVGIGASAGGLEALEEFLRHVPEGSGMAFVVVQHLDPTHKGMLPELLQRATPMKVVQVRDRIRVKPGCVYVIPPNRDMSLLHGALYLFEPTAPRGLRLPIDFLFRSLAADQNERSIGVVLSGMGADGTLGLRAIKQAAGLVLVQDPSTAKFDAMPRSVVAAGLADVVAPVQELPERILAYVRHAPLHGRTAPLLPDGERSALEKIAIVLRARTGHDFSLYKSSTVLRRIERRMGIHQIDRIATYVQYLQKNRQEVDLLFRELLIGVTSFFRDPAAWDQLRDEVLPPLLANRPPRSVLRAWSAGCSTGEEAFSLAIVFREAVEKVASEAGLTLQVFATDLDGDAIARARQALFPPGIASSVSAGRLKRFFVQEGGSFRIGNEIREMVTFATQNVLMDPPFTKLDLLLCRNLLIYLGPELQKRLLPLFHYSLNPGGTLFLGAAETAGGQPGLFTPLPGKTRLYRRGETLVPLAAMPFPASRPGDRKGAPTPMTVPKPVPDLQALADQVLLQRFSPAAVLVNGEGDILFISGRTGKYLEPAAGKANWNVFAMAREGLRQELPELFHRAVGTRSATHRRGIRLGSGEEESRVDVTAQALAEPEGLRGTVMIVFSDVLAPHVPSDVAPRKAGAPRTPEAATLRRELDEARAALQSLRSEMHAMHEEMQTSQEELKSANEELQSTNEELQSTNEELTTAKEEMQSMNEELQTVNAEQASRMEELTRASDDMKNLLNGTDIATVFLDGELRVRRFTTGATRLFKLIPGDVGRPLSDVVNALVDLDLAREAREVLRTLVPSLKQVAAEGERWFEVRVLPYRTVDNRIDGVVLTFVDITKTKVLESELRRAAQEAAGPGPDREDR